MELSDNARKIMDLRYSRKDEEGSPTETPEQVIHRVAANVAVVTGLYGETSGVGYPGSVDFGEFPWRTVHRYAESFGGENALRNQLASHMGAINTITATYEGMLERREFFPNSPTWTGAGTPLGQLSACFVLPIDDDLGRGRASIFETLQNAALIQQTGGGNGFSFSRLRPNDSVVSKSMGKASGPVGFMQAYDGCFQIIAQGGSRRGANMGVLRIDHPDVSRFIKAKTEEGKVEGFNISVAVTDAFMEAVKDNDTFDLVFDGRVYETIKAADLFAEIAKDAWKFGDPGLLFIDRANRDNPCPVRYAYESTNPCGEQWLPPYGSCNLGSIALQRFVKDGVRGSKYLDWMALEECIVNATFFLDDVIDANAYVDGVPELEESAKGERRIGLGYMGVADTLALLGISYGSSPAQDFVYQVTEFLRYHAMRASISRAVFRGPFLHIEGSIFDPKLLKVYGFGTQVSPNLRTWDRPAIGGGSHDFGRPDLNWMQVEENLRDHGIRNACLLTYAPTGTISNVADCEGSGIECLFALAYERHVMQEGEDVRLTYVSKLFSDALRQAVPLWGEARFQEALDAVASNKGSCQGLDIIPQSIQDVFKVAGDLTPEEHIRMQAAAQKWVDNSISKTINMPKSSTVGDVESAYLLAYELGAKGITIYRNESRKVEVLTTSSTPDPIEIVSPGSWPVITPMEIPKAAWHEGLPTRTFPVRTGFGTLQVYLTEHPEHPDRLFDCRISIGKAGSDKNADVEALARMISISLRCGVDVESIVDQLKGIGGRTVEGFGPNKVLSVADGVGKLLERLYCDRGVPVLIPEESGNLQGVQDLSRTCPRCGNASLVYESGCAHCDIRLGGCGNFEGCD